jgi:prepilin-type processing-associated H-X9-DG protein
LNNEGVSSYVFVHGSMGPDQGISQQMKMYNTGIFNYLETTKRGAVRDGLSNTMAVGEVYDGHRDDFSNRWTQAHRHLDNLRSTTNPINTPPATGITTSPYPPQVMNGAMGSRHPGGAQFAFADGHVQLLTENMSLTVYRALSTKNGKEAVSVN